jgi:hypothetical protein
MGQLMEKQLAAGHVAEQLKSRLGTPAEICGLVHCGLRYC